jgi:hypothetical protein
MWIVFVDEYEIQTDTSTLVMLSLIASVNRLYPSF